MAYFAQIDENGTVLQVISVSNNDAPDPAPSNSEPAGQAFIASLGLPGEWRQTSYHMSGGVHANGGTPLRYNYCGPGFTFSDDPQWASQGGAFIPPKPEEGDWILDPDTALWVEA